MFENASHAFDRASNLGYWLLRCAIACGRQGLAHDRVQRRRILEIKHVFECMRMLVPLGQVQPANLIVEAQEALLDKGQQGSVIPYRMRDVVRLRKWRDRHKRNAESQLVKAGALVGVRARGVRRHSWAE